MISFSWTDGSAIPDEGLGRRNREGERLADLMRLYQKAMTIEAFFFFFFSFKNETKEKETDAPE